MDTKKKEISFALGNNARETLAKSLSDIADAVGSTMGPGGAPFGFDSLNVHQSLSPSFSKDGLTVLKALKFDKPEDQAVLYYCKQASGHSVLESGDGTTSTIVLANEVAKQILKNDSRYPQFFARVLERDSKRAIENIKAEAITDQEAVRKVALTSSNGDEELTDVVMQSIAKSSAFGSLLTIKNPLAKERYKISVQDGYSFCRGYNYDTMFAASASENAPSSLPIEWKNPYVIVFNGNLVHEDQFNDLMRPWQEACKTDARNLIMVCYDVGEGFSNKVTVLNRKLASSGISAFAVKVKLTGEVNSGIQILRDIAAYSGIENENILDGGNFRQSSISSLGTVQNLTVTPTSTVFQGRSENHWVEKRVIQNHNIAESAENEFDREQTKVRNAELSNGLVQVEIGDGHLPDLREREDRFDDASRAAKACLTNGALPGAGSSYIRAAALTDDINPALAEALRAVNKRILENFGVDSDPSYNPESGETIFIDFESLSIKNGDALEMGVLDATDTVVSVIKNGVSLGIKIATLGGFLYRDRSKFE